MSDYPDIIGPAFATFALLIFTVPFIHGLLGNPISVLIYIFISPLIAISLVKGGSYLILNWSLKLEEGEQ